MPSQVEIQREINDRILEGLKNGVVPWRKPWRVDPNCGAPANFASRRPYSGINPILLDLVAMSQGYDSRWWGTYRQWSDAGAQVKRRPADLQPGQWGTRIVLWKQIERNKRTADGIEETERFPILRYFTVFNLDQVEGSAVDHLRASVATTPDSPLGVDYEPAQRAIDATSAEIRYGGNRAYYVRPIGEFPNHTGGDFICLPDRGQFVSLHDFYAVAFHELCHWTQPRRGWTGSYPMGELIAEIGACFLCAQVGIPNSNDLSNHTAYLASWLKELESDPRAILKAASQAFQATQMILGFSQKESTAEAGAVV